MNHSEWCVIVWCLIAAMCTKTQFQPRFIFFFFRMRWETGSFFYDKIRIHFTCAYVRAIMFKEKKIKYFFLFKIKITSQHHRNRMFKQKIVRIFASLVERQWQQQEKRRAVQKKNNNTEWCLYVLGRSRNGIIQSNCIFIRHTTQFSGLHTHTLFFCSFSLSSSFSRVFIYIYVYIMDTHTHTRLEICIHYGWEAGGQAVCSETGDGIRVNMCRVLYR